MSYSITDLKAAGFCLKTYKEQNGEFLAKETVIEGMPYAGQHLPDGDFILGTMKVITEVTPGGQVQMCIPEADTYFEGPHPFESEEGQALLRDAVEAK